jgi:four helix bundle protein
MAKKIDELPVYFKACELAVAVSAILKNPGLRKDHQHRKQISEALDSIQANMEEGFEQGTDRAFANFLTHSKGSVGEVVGHLRRARRKDYITVAEEKLLVPQAEELGKMLGGFIKYLRNCDWTDRGRHGYDAPDDGGR